MEAVRRPHGKIGSAHLLAVGGWGLHQGNVSDHRRPGFLGAGGVRGDGHSHCDSRCAGCFSKAHRGQPLLGSWATLDRRPRREQKDQGLHIGYYSSRPVSELEGEKTHTLRTLESTRPLPRESKKVENPCFLRGGLGGLKGYGSSGRGQSPTHPRKA